MFDLKHVSYLSLSLSLYIYIYMQKVIASICLVLVGGLLLAFALGLSACWSLMSNVPNKTINQVRIITALPFVNCCNVTQFLLWVPMQFGTYIAPEHNQE